MSFKSIVKGWLGEVQSTIAKKIFLDADSYTDINNVTIPIANGFTQIDHVIVSRYGIFVIETKNMSGWIFGSDKNPWWTQSLFGKSFKFPNPLHQNYRHTQALSDFLGVDHDKILSVVMFWGNCRFKTPMPPNVMTHGYTAYIKSQAAVLFPDDALPQIVAALKEGMLPKTWATRRRHVAALKARFDSTTTCPKCSSPLALRIAKSGANAGSSFYGCSKYPACRYVRKMEK